MLPCCSHVLLAVFCTLVTAAPRSSFRPIPLPTDFSSYDLNGDANIDVSELANVSDTSEAQASKPFLSADTNHDGLINAEEFHSAPWDLQGTLGANQDQKDEDEDQQDPADNDYMDDEGRGIGFTEDEDENDDKKDDDTVNDDDDDAADDENDGDDDDYNNDVDDNSDNEDRGIDGDDDDDGNDATDDSNQ